MIMLGVIVLVVGISVMFGELWVDERQSRARLATREAQHEAFDLHAASAPYIRNTALLAEIERARHDALLHLCEDARRRQASKAERGGFAAGIAARADLTGAGG